MSLLVKREFKSNKTRRGFPASLVAALVFTRILIFDTSQSSAQWHKIQDLGSQVSDLYFNQWGIGFTGNFPSGPNYPSGVWRSTDSGRTWQQPPVGIDSEYAKWRINLTTYEHPVWPFDFTFKDSLTGWFVYPVDEQLFPQY